MKKNSFINGAIIATLAIIVSKILGVLYVIPFYNIIGEQGGALYGYAYSIYNIFLTISSAGLPLAISKLTSEYNTQNKQEEKKAMYLIANKIVLIFSFISFSICFIFAKPIAHLILGNLTGGNSYNDVAFVIRSISFAILIVPQLGVLRGFLQGHNYIKPSVFSQVLEQIVRILIILVGSYTTQKIFHLPITISVGISTFAACAGAIVSFIYLIIKSKNNQLIPPKNAIKKTNQKEICKKIIKYSIPFIIVNIINNLYNTTDMILIIHTLNKIGYSGDVVETISSIFTTWGDKILSIIKAIASGLTISLIPSIVSAYVSKDQKNVNLYFNKAIQIILFIIFPITIIMSMFSLNIWTLFYKDNFYGPNILKYTAILANFESAYLIVGCALQGLYKHKLIYITTCAGLLTNIILDVPLMLLFNKLNIYPYYGAITATIIGHIISLSISFTYLKRKENFSYKKTLSKIPSVVLSMIIIIIINSLYQRYIPKPTNYLYNIFYLLVITLIDLLFYIAINFKHLKYLLKDNKKNDTSNSN